MPNANGHGPWPESPRSARASAFAPSPRAITARTSNTSADASAGLPYDVPMLNVGDRAPAFTAEDNDGNTVRLEDLRGKFVVLYFFPKAFTFG